MTIGGALSDLNNLLKADDIPFYYKPSIKAVIDTITLEQEPYICDTCKHKDAEWDTEPCDGCCGAHSGYEPSDGVIYYPQVEGITPTVVKSEPCDDAVSRQAVIQIFDRWLEIGDYNYSERNIMNCAISEIKDLPSVQPKRQTGKCECCENIEKNNIRFECYWIDAEGHTASFQDKEKHLVATQIARYCPICGRKLDYRICD